MQVYTDMSAQHTVRNGGAGIKCSKDMNNKICLATGCLSTNYKAEANAIQTAATYLQSTAKNIVFLTDTIRSTGPRVCWS